MSPRQLINSLAEDEDGEHVEIVNGLADDETEEGQKT